jgi:hypothetical protein
MCSAGCEGAESIPGRAGSSSVEHAHVPRKHRKPSDEADRSGQLRHGTGVFQKVEHIEEPDWGMPEQSASTEHGLPVTISMRSDTEVVGVKLAAVGI